MSKQVLLTIVVITLVIGAGAFYGGMKYQESKTPRGFARGDFQNLQNLSPEQREQFSQERIGRGLGSGLLNGEVIAKDEQSLTLKLPDGSSKIIFFSGSTEISKMTEGSIGDIEVGKQIMVSGDQNPDGSYTAKTIQLSPRYLIPEK